MEILGTVAKRAIKTNSSRSVEWLGALGNDLFVKFAGGDKYERILVLRGANREVNGKTLLDILKELYFSTRHIGGAVHCAIEGYRNFAQVWNPQSGEWEKLQ